MLIFDKKGTIQIPNSGYTSYLVSKHSSDMWDRGTKLFHIQLTGEHAPPPATSLLQQGLSSTICLFYICFYEHIFITVPSHLDNTLSLRQVSVAVGTLLVNGTNV